MLNRKFPKWFLQEWWLVILLRKYHIFGQQETCFSWINHWFSSVQSLSRVWLLATPWTAAHQAPLSMGFYRHEYWSGVPLPSPPSRLWFFQWSYMDMRVGLWRKLSTEELMLLNCGVGEDSWESLGLQGDPTSSFWRRSALGFPWKEWC